LNTAAVRAVPPSRRSLAFGVIVVVGISLASGAQSASPPRLVGSYQTLSRVLVQTQNGGVNPVGYTAVRTWRFVRHCPNGVCTTTLFRPSITPGSTRVIAYSLHVAGSGNYTGALRVPDICYSAGESPIKVLPLGSAVDHVVITIRPTKRSSGRVLAYEGTMVIKGTPSGSGAAEGCVVHSFEKESVRSPA
jgi:hypothetical protein